MDSFPLSGWLIMLVPPILMITSVVLFYLRELRKEKLENELSCARHGIEGLTWNRQPHIDRPDSLFAAHAGNWHLVRQS